MLPERKSPQKAYSSLVNVCINGKEKYPPPYRMSRTPSPHNTTETKQNNKTKKLKQNMVV